ncbi:MAG TPA: DsbA family protein [Solirubrobacteraceae bacterium]|nr:DsbA family protein [Solirubrobacteraceae bacterium]
MTDPADPWSWAAEPAVRRLTVEFGDELAITYVMGGFARRVTDGAAVARRALDAAAAAGMPADPRLWLDGHPASSYPACLAVKAAAEQGLDAAVLRVLREGFMVDRRRQDTPAALLEAVRAVDGLDVERFAVDLRSNAIVEAFGADLDVARGGGPGGAGLTLPSWRIRGEGHGDVVLAAEGAVPALRDAVLAAGAVAVGALPDAETAVRRLGRAATAEVAAVCDLPGPRAPAELWRLALEWRVRAERVLGGEMWSAA